MAPLNQSYIEDDNSRKSYIEEVLFITEEQFNKCIKQIDILNAKIKDLQIRYNRESSRKNGLHFTLRLQIATFEGVRCVFYKYANEKALFLDKLYSQHQRILQQNHEHNHDHNITL